MCLRVWEHTQSHPSFPSFHDAEHTQLALALLSRAKRDPRNAERILRVISSHASPSLELTTAVLELMALSKTPDVFLQALPRLCGSKVTHVCAALDAMEALLRTRGERCLDVTISSLANFLVPLHEDTTDAMQRLMKQIFSCVQDLVIELPVISRALSASFASANLEFVIETIREQAHSLEDNVNNGLYDQLCSTLLLPLQLGSLDSYVDSVDSGTNISPLDLLVLLSLAKLPIYRDVAISAIIRMFCVDLFTEKHLRIALATDDHSENHSARIALLEALFLAKSTDASALASLGVVASSILFRRHPSIQSQIVRIVLDAFSLDRGRFACDAFGLISEESGYSELSNFGPLFSERILTHFADCEEVCAETLEQSCSILAELCRLSETTLIQTLNRLSKMLSLPLLHVRALCLCLSKYLQLAQLLTEDFTDLVIRSIPPKARSFGKQMIPQLYCLDFLGSLPASRLILQHLIRLYVMTEPSCPLAVIQPILQADFEGLNVGFYSGPPPKSVINDADFRPLWVYSLARTMRKHDPNWLWTGAWIESFSWELETSMTAVNKFGKTACELSVLLAAGTSWINHHSGAHDAELRERIIWVCTMRRKCQQMSFLDTVLAQLPIIRLELLFETFGTGFSPAVVAGVATHLESIASLLLTTSKDFALLGNRKTFGGAPKLRMPSLPLFSHNATSQYLLDWDQKAILRQVKDVLSAAVLSGFGHSLCVAAGAGEMGPELPRLIYYMLVVLNHFDQDSAIEFLAQFGASVCDFVEGLTLQDPSLAVHWTEVLLVACKLKPELKQSVNDLIADDFLAMALPDAFDFHFKIPLAMSAPFLVYRVSDSWNQTGQRHALPVVKRDVFFDLSPDSKYPVAAFHMYFMTSLTEVLDVKISSHWLEMSLYFAQALVVQCKVLKINRDAHVPSITQSSAPVCFHYALINLHRLLDQATSVDHLVACCNILSLLAACGMSLKKVPLVSREIFMEYAPEIFFLLGDKLESAAENDKIFTDELTNSCREINSRMLKFFESNAGQSLSKPRITQCKRAWYNILLIVD